MRLDVPAGISREVQKNIHENDFFADHFPQNLQNENLLATLETVSKLSRQGGWKIATLATG